MFSATKQNSPYRSSLPLAIVSSEDSLWPGLTRQIPEEKPPKPPLKTTTPLVRRREQSIVLGH